MFDRLFRQFKKITLTDCTIYKIMIYKCYIFRYFKNSSKSLENHFKSLQPSQ